LHRIPLQGIFALARRPSKKTYIFPFHSPNTDQETYGGHYGYFQGLSHFAIVGGGVVYRYEDHGTQAGSTA
jgi:hypothetical protein